MFRLASRRVPLFALGRVALVRKLDAPWRNGVDSKITVLTGAGDVAREDGEAGLADRVAWTEGVIREGAWGGDVDDAGAWLGVGPHAGDFHVRDTCPCGMRRADQVDVEVFLQHLQGFVVIYLHLFWPVRTYTADDVDQKIDITVLEETLSGGTYGVGKIPAFLECNDAQTTAWKYSTVRVEQFEESVNVGVKHANTVAFPEEMVGYVAANPLSAASDDDVVNGLAD